MPLSLMLKSLILNDRKEMAEHNTIVDLIRNDLSIFADNVEVRQVTGILIKSKPRMEFCCRLVLR